MLLLATDTSGKDGSIALAQCGPDDECKILDVVPLAGGTFSAQLVPQIAGLLQEHGFTRGDIGAFAVASGPGSFTGLRVGLAAIKALAEVLHKPIAAVSLLEAVGVAAGTESVLAVLDAGRGEFYVGEWDGGVLSRESLLTGLELLEQAKGRLVVTPDPAVASNLRSANLIVQEVPRQRSDAVARLGWKKIQAGDTVSPADLEANYIRRSDAEIFAKPHT